MRVRLNAVNWYGAESSDFVVGGLGSASLAAIVQQVKGMGLNAVRLPWSNELYETNPKVASSALAANPALEGEDALTILDQVVNALTAAGMMVILDNHNSDAEWCCGDDGNTLWYNSRYSEANWLSDWAGMAARYAGNPLVVGADLRNEPRVSATWGGAAATDWHAAAERGGNAILAVNPHLLIFVEGTNYSLDLSGAAGLPVVLNVQGQLVYEAHDYGFDYSGLTGYSDYVNRITPRWGYLVTGANPAPVWLGEFGTCNSNSVCVASANPNDSGYWFGFVTTYLQAHDLDWSYWPVNGTQSTGAGRNWGAAEAYGVLNASWNGAALPALAQALGNLSSAGFAMASNGNITVGAPGAGGASSVTLTPQNGFSGTVNLNCTLTSGPSNGQNPPVCTVPASVSFSGGVALQAAVTIATTGSAAAGNHWQGWPRRIGGGAALCCLLLLPGLARRRWRVMVVAAFVVAGLAAVGCGSGSGSGAGGGVSTTTGNYSFTVTGTASGQAPISVQIAVTVL